MRLKSYLFKVDEVANLKVVGLFLEQDTNTDGKKIARLFSDTERAVLFLLPLFPCRGKNWYPWEKIQVDVPTYDVEDADGKITENGRYLIPVVWNKRLLVFFPQFVRKTAPDDTKPLLYWEIKMAWSEYRNGKWTQKQVSADSVYDKSTDPESLPDINAYEFIPRSLRD